MSADLTKIKDRIRKLLNLAADDAATNGEIDAALTAASQLMLKHQLSEDDCTEVQRTPEQLAASTQYASARSWSDSQRSRRWDGLVALAISEFFGTLGYYQAYAEVHRSAAGIVRNDGKPVVSFIFYGPADDAQFAAELHAELTLTAACMAKLRFGGGLMSGPGRDYCDGFASGLLAKVRAAKSVAPKLLTQTSECTALSIVRSQDITLRKRQHADKWLRNEQGIKLGKAYGRGRSTGNGSAYREGYSDGQSESLSRNRPARLT